MTDLMGEEFFAYKGMNGQYTGLSIVIRRLKNGLYMCKSVDGSVTFNDCKERILRGIEAVRIDKVCVANGFKTHEQHFGSKKDGN